MKLTSVARARRSALPLAAAAFVLAVAPVARGASYTFTVDTDGSAVDDNQGNGTCHIAAGGCTLHAAIQEANNIPPIGTHSITIQFSIPTVTLTASLPQINVPVTIDGGGSRTELLGGPGPGHGPYGGILLAASAGGSTVKNLVIGYMSGAGISIVGGGNTVQNCYIGTDTAGTTAHPNSSGLSITFPALGPYPPPVPPPVLPPDISGVAPTLIGDTSDASKGNLISGNEGVGIDIFAERTVKVTVANNLIGTDVTGNASLPNGSDGVHITGNAWANTIGPGNVISGNTNPVAVGVRISGMVWEPNVVTGNVIGTSKDLSTNLGHWLTGIVVDSTRFDPAYPEQVATIGPGNVIGFATEDGVSITGSCEKVRLFGNFIGVAADPANSSVFVNVGNGRDGVRISTSGVNPTDPTTHGHLIGGTTPIDANVISANGTAQPPGGSGITLVSSSATNITIRGNVIGRDPLNLQNFPNTLDGITVLGNGNNVIGGTGLGEANVIAGNLRNGIKVTSTGNGWANLISGNSIFGNDQGGAGGVGIDLDVVANGADPADNSTPGPDPNLLYANYGQNAPVVSSGANAPHYDPVTGSIVVDWTLETAPSTPVTIEFFTNDAAGVGGNGEGQKLVGSLTTVTDGTGHASGLSPVVPPSPFDSRGKFLTMTATSTNTVDPPGPTTSGPANNTSEFSNAVRIPNPGVLQLSSATYGVGESGGTATITVTRTGGSDGQVTIDYATSDGSATAGVDYGTATGTLTWNDGDGSSKTFSVSILPDTIREGNETVNLALSNPGGYAELGSPSTAVLTITDDDPQPTISVTSVALPEGNSGTTPFPFVVTLSNPTTQTVTVDYATQDGTAKIADSDYGATSGTLTFLPLATTQFITVNVDGDTSVEPDETFLVNLSNPANASILVAPGTGTIQNDDNPTPTFSVNGVTQAEGNSGTTTFTFTVTLSPTSASPTTVDVATADGTATTADGDYVAGSQTLSFPAGTATQQFSVTVNGDTKLEPDETFGVGLSNPTGGAAASASPGVGTITNDDGAPAIVIGDVAHLEGNSGTTAFVFPVTLSNASSQTVTVDWATADGTATVANNDYASASGTLTFAPGVTAQTATVNANGDAANEPDETFFVNLTNPANASIADAQGQGTIQNDDSPTPVFTVDSVTQAEGNSGTTGFVFTVTMSPTSASPATVDAATADGTATVADGDYVANSQTLSFPANTSTQTFTVTVNGDTKFEPAEAFTVGLSNPTGGGGATASPVPGTGTVSNDDTTPSISITDVTQAEGNSGTTAFTFAVSLSNASSQTVSASWATADGTATVAGSDYAAGSGTVTFNPGVTSQTVTVDVTGDTTDEPDETFLVNLSNPVNASIADGQGVGTVQNDDATTPTFTIGSVTQGEGNAGTTSFVFTVTLNPTSPSATSVDAATADGTATAADGDYVANAQTLSFPAGTSTQTFTVTVNGDTKFEPTEAFTVALSGPTGGALASALPGTGTITNDDTAPTVAIGDVSQLEGNSGTTAFVFPVTLSNPTSQTVTVDWATADGTATTANADYASASGTVTFGPGVTAQTVTVDANGDTSPEPDETFAVSLTNPVNASIADSQAVGTILDDDSAPTFTIASVTQAEGAGGATTFVFTVTLAPTSASTTTVQASTADGTATAASGDYVASTQTLTFPPGVSTQTFSVTVNGDDTFEGDETFAVALSNPTGGAVASPLAATGTISNDDPQPAMSVADVTAPAQSSGAALFTFTITLSNPSSQTLSVSWATADGTATAAAGDYVPASGTVTFPPGVTTRTFTISITTNATSGPAKTFFVNLSVPVNGTIARSQAIGTILPAAASGRESVPTLGGVGLAALTLLLAAAGALAIRRLG